MNMKSRWCASLFAALLALAASSGVLAQSKPIPNASSNAIGNATRTATNNILTVRLEDTTGAFTVVTGASHPTPGATVLFGCCTSNLTFRDATASIMFTNGSLNPGLAGYTAQNISATPPVVTNLGTNGFQVVWTIPNWTITEVVSIAGSTLADTNVRQSVTITNTSAGARTYGLRYLWDWQINGNDASFFRTRNPDGAYTNVFTTFTNPAFPIYEEADNPTTPTFSVFGSVGGGSLSPPATVPEQLRYSSWSTSVGSAWDYTNTGSASDSSVVYFWGFATPLTLAAGASATYTEYLTTVVSSIGGGGGGPTGPQLIPTLSQWGLMLLIALLGGISIWTIRRKF
jgi:hypothetical protein